MGHADRVYWPEQEPKGRAWVIGNGNSLAHTPLHLLEGEVTFALNLINLIYPRTTWRPTHYLAFDFFGPPDHAHTMKESLRLHADMGCRCYIRADKVHMLEPIRRPRWPQDVTYHQTCGAHAGIDVTSDRRPTDWHLPVLCGFGTTLSAIVQICVMENYNPIYLLGCDLGFEEPGGPVDPDPNHFDPNYRTFIDNLWEYRDETLRYTHQIMEVETQALGFKVYNATLGGLLEEHERVDMLEVLK